MEAKNEEKKEVIDLSDGGKKEVLKFAVSGKDVVIVADFNKLNKAAALLQDLSVTGTGENSKASMNIDHISAGDFLLFQCWHDGDEAVREQARLRFKAARYIGEWVQDLTDDETGIEKKN